MTGKRKRIFKKVNDIDVIVDESAYRENACSKNAKYISVFDDRFKIEFWIDKHYSIRDLFGEDNGEAREGIDIESVTYLISKGFKHLFYYASKHNFLFVNHPPKRERGIRVVIQQVYPKSEKLNVVVEYHFISLNVYEVTVVTAMCKDNYVLFDGQHAIEFHEDSSILYFREMGTTNVIDDYSE